MSDQMRNPLLEPEDYGAQYRQSAEALKNHPQIVEIDRLCYEIFEMNTHGKRLMEILTERYLLTVAGTPGSPTYPQECMWSEGVRYAYLLLRNSAKQHKQRIEAGK